MARLRRRSGSSLPDTPNPPSTPEHKTDEGSDNRDSPRKFCGSRGSGGGSGNGSGANSRGSQSSPSRNHQSVVANALDGAASAFQRRLYFRTAGGSRSCTRTVPKVVVMGSSTASETTINTSTDSANTMVTLITTTDGEQADDSLDYLDGAPELSPPPVTAPTPKSQSQSQSQSQVLQQESDPPYTAYARANHSVSTTNLHDVQIAPVPPPVSLTTNNQTQNSNSLTESPKAPPPTPLVGSQQESRFTFVSGRTPPLPDLRVTDFFSTPVRGSVDAGQPDPNQINSLLSLVAANERKNSTTSVNSAMKNSQRVKGEKNCSEFTGKGNQKAAKANINVTTNPLDISLCGGGQTASCAQGSTGSRTRSRTPGGSGGTNKRTTQATIVVQQPSLSLDAPASTILLRPDADARRREDNIRQLLDVANTFTKQEIHDFERRYGSPHHSRSQSVKTPGSRASGRPNYLCLPQQRSRVASMPNTGHEEEYYRLRHFSITVKGIVNRGDSLKSRRSRSNNSVASSNSSTEHLTASYAGSARTSAAGSLASSRESSASQGPAPYSVLMLGAPAVGKSSLVSKFMSSEDEDYDTSVDDESGEKTVSVLLEGEESELTFIDQSSADMTPEECIATYDPHAYCVVYSTIDSSSVEVAEKVLQTLWRSDHVSSKAVILVGNKVDLVRGTLVSAEDGKSMATSYDCKFIETSVVINHKVDELLVGLLSQIRLKLENPEHARDIFSKRSRKNRNRSPLGSSSENNSPKKYRGSRTSASLKVRTLLGKVWARDSKSKSCENLHVL
ncbi:uncharacterized protein LOC105694056 [Athalia rosae]|uniref:uncharacterized protein LOC105694056 n=1 Tax=Athalia rosae TaxID=37344 RepID=UPI000A0EE8A2|nr:uncharacterized protein LOC105694056 [Athalia rosae]XP_048506408.1 uncharacterized protein LOC105694056 [Athalia rosae]